MATEILMPKLGLTMTEGLIQKWLVQVGDTVTSGQPLLEISSEKLTSEVESPASGVVLDIAHGHPYGRRRSECLYGTDWFCAGCRHRLYLFEKGLQSGTIL